jgi:hypothetical protein
MYPHLSISMAAMRFMEGFGIKVLENSWGVKTRSRS